MIQTVMHRLCADSMEKVAAAPPSIDPRFSRVRLPQYTNLPPKVWTTPTVPGSPVRPASPTARPIKPTPPPRVPSQFSKTVIRQPTGASLRRSAGALRPPLTIDVTPGRPQQFVGSSAAPVSRSQSLVSTRPSGGGGTGPRSGPGRARFRPAGSWFGRGRAHLRNIGAAFSRRFGRGTGGRGPIITPPRSRPLLTGPTAKALSKMKIGPLGSALYAAMLVPGAMSFMKDMKGMRGGVPKLGSYTKEAGVPGKLAKLPLKAAWKSMKLMGKAVGGKNYSGLLFLPFMVGPGMLDPKGFSRSLKTYRGVGQVRSLKNRPPNPDELLAEMASRGMLKRSSAKDILKNPRLLEALTGALPGIAVGETSFRKQRRGFQEGGRIGPKPSRAANLATGLGVGAGLGMSAGALAKHLRAAGLASRLRTSAKAGGTDQELAKLKDWLKLRVREDANTAGVLDQRMLDLARKKGKLKWVKPQTPEIIATREQFAKEMGKMEEGRDTLQRLVREVGDFTSKPVAPETSTVINRLINEYADRKFPGYMGRKATTQPSARGKSLLKYLHGGRYKASDFLGG